MRCSCGKDATIPLFNGEKRQWGFCPEHADRWDIYPVIYIDGLGYNAIEYLKDKVAQIRYRKPYSDVVISYPTSVDGVGTYTDKAVQSLQYMAEYMRQTNFASISPTKPILFVGSPFALFAQCLLLGKDRAEQYAVHFLRRPAVWVVVSHDQSYPAVLRQVVRTAHKTQPFTFTRFMVIGKATVSYWLPFKVAYRLWVAYSANRKRFGKLQKGVSTIGNDTESAIGVGNVSDFSGEDADGGDRFDADND